jgi:beta-glucosidase
VADVLFGRVNPSGHLSVSWPSEATRNPPLSQFNPGAPSLLGDQPKFFDQLPGTTPARAPATTRATRSALACRVPASRPAAFR